MAVIDQLENLIRLGISFSILFFVIAPIIFKENGGLGERFFSRYIKMVFLIIIAGYAFVLIKLYEVISLFTFIALFAIFWRMPAGSRLQTLRERYQKVAILFYETVDGRFSPLAWARPKFKGKLDDIRKFLLAVIRSPLNYLLFTVIAGAAYLRFADPLTHAAPGLSDASVAIAWMKYISERILFHDGIYPQGLHIYNATLRKFAGTDAIYVVKYIGPFNGVLTTIVLYFFVYQLTGRKSAGIISAFVFGIMGPFLYLGWERQAATNSQEFALIFMFLAWHYAIRYFNTREKRHLWTATIALAVMGLVHSLIWAFASFGVVLIALSYFIFGPRKNFRSILNIALGGVVSGVISTIPLGIGLMMGKGYHSSSLNYLTSVLPSEPQQLTNIDYSAAGGILLIMVLFLLSKWMQERPEPLLFTALLSIATMLAYIYLGWLTGNTLIIGRIGILWSVVVCIALGIGWHSLIKIFIRVIALEVILCWVLLFGVTYLYQPTPSQPYKMLHDVMVNQYLRIANEFSPTTWIMVSNEEGYALSLGKGWHIHLDDFVESYSPETKKIVNIRDGTGESLETEDIFIFIEKRVFEPPLSEVRPLIEKRKKYYPLLEDWVKTYSSLHDNIEVYYEDHDLKVYHISQPKKREFEKVWNIEDNQVTEGEEYAESADN